MHPLNPLRGRSSTGKRLEPPAPKYLLTATALLLLLGLAVLPALTGTEQHAASHAFEGISDEDMDNLVKDSSIEELARELRKDCAAHWGDKCDEFSRSLARDMKELQQTYEESAPAMEAARQEVDRDAAQRMAGMCDQEQAERIAYQAIAAREHPRKGEIITPEEWQQQKRDAAQRVAKIDATLAARCRPGGSH